MFYLAGAGNDAMCFTVTMRLYLAIYSYVVQFIKLEELPAQISLAERESSYPEEEEKITNPSKGLVKCMCLCICVFYYIILYVINLNHAVTVSMVSCNFICFVIKVTAFKNSLKNTYMQLLTGSAPLLKP